MVGFNRKNFKLANVNGLNDPKETTKKRQNTEICKMRNYNKKYK